MPLLYIDSNVFIYALSGQQPFNAAALDILRRIDYGSDHSGAASAITYSEVIGYSKNPGSVKPAHTFLTGLRHMVFMPVDLQTAQKAGYLRQKYGTSLKLGDAIHLATAIEHKADIFITNDLILAKIAKKLLPTQTLTQS